MLQLMPSRMPHFLFFEMGVLLFIFLHMLMTSLLQEIIPLLYHGLFMHFHKSFLLKAWGRSTTFLVLRFYPRMKDCSFFSINTSGISWARSIWKVPKKLVPPMSTLNSLVLRDRSPPTDATMFRQLVGGLQYLSITRPKNSFMVNKLS